VESLNFIVMLNLDMRAIQIILLFCCSGHFQEYVEKTLPKSIIWKYLKIDFLSVSDNMGV